MYSELTRLIPVATAVITTCIKQQFSISIKSTIQKQKPQVMKSKILVLLLVVLSSLTAFAQTEKVGKMTVTAFNNINAKGSAKVSAIVATKTALNNADKNMLLKIAAGGMRQLEISKAVLAKTTNAQVKILAQSEVDEQTGLSAKLTEIAMAKGITLPATLDAAAQALVDQANNLSGAALNAFYIKESGIKGHEMLQKTMLGVSAAAKDGNLKKLASATLPVIATHLTVSKQVKAMM